jgi:hypothetical protein
MATKTKKPRNRAAQEVTLINLRALKKQVRELAAAVEHGAHAIVHATSEQEKDTAVLAMRDAARAVKNELE